MKVPAELPLDGSKPLPFAPGDSPFRIKGVAYRGHVDYVVEHVFVRTRSRYQAGRDIRGIYKVLLKLVSPMHVIHRMPALQAQYLDFAGDGQVNVLGDKRVELLRGALPGLLASWFSTVNEAYVEVVLTAAGARSVLARTDPPVPEGSVHGVPAVKWRCEVSWA